MMEVVRWAAQSNDTAPAEILADVDDSGLWSASLNAAINNDPRYKAGVWGQVKQALEPFMLPSVRQVAGIRALESFTADAFLDDWNTLYMLGSPNEQQAVAGLCAALADHVVETARRRAGVHGRLTIPLLLALDEAPNVAPIPKLDQLMSTGGGSGICTMLVVQSVDQARNAWGPIVGEALLRDLATQRVVLGGLGSAKDLKDITSLLGEHDEIIRSVSSRGARGFLAAPDISVNTRLRPVLSESQIREIDSQLSGEALLIPRSGKAAIVRLHPIWNMP
jgi:type IV secretory pathway TraG/TraD family ATPase VirD4